MTVLFLGLVAMFILTMALVAYYEIRLYKEKELTTNDTNVLSTTQKSSLVLDYPQTQQQLWVSQRLYRVYYSWFQKCDYQEKLYWDYKKWLWRCNDKYVRLEACKAYFRNKDLVRDDDRIRPKNFLKDPCTLASRIDVKPYPALDMFLTYIHWYKREQNENLKIQICQAMHTYYDWMIKYNPNILMDIVPRCSLTLPPTTTIIPENKTTEINETSTAIAITNTTSTTWYKKIYRWLFRKSPPPTTTPPLQTSTTTKKMPIIIMRVLGYKAGRPILSVTNTDTVCKHIFRCHPRSHHYCCVLYL